MRKTDKKIYLYNRNRVIYTDNNKSYIIYNYKYVLLTTIKGGGINQVISKNEEVETEAEAKKEQEKAEKAKKEQEKAEKEEEKAKKQEEKAEKEEKAKKKEEKAEKEEEKAKAKKKEEKDEAKAKKEEEQAKAEENKLIKKDREEAKAKKKEEANENKLIEKEDKDKYDKEVEEKKAEELRNKLQRMLEFKLTNAATRCNKYYTSINLLCIKTYEIFNNNGYDDDEDKKNFIEKNLYLYFFQYYMTEIIREGIYGDYIRFIKNRLGIDNNFNEITQIHSNAYLDDFVDFKEHWKNKRSEMGDTNELKIQINAIDFENDKLYEKEHNDTILKKKLEESKKNSSNLVMYVDFIIYFFKYITYTSLKREFNDIKNYVNTFY